MPKEVEDCVKKIHGTNKRTGEPYTESEKWAICKSAHKNSNSEITEEAIADKVMEVIDMCKEKLISSGKAQNYESATALTDVLLARTGYNIEILELII